MRDYEAPAKLNLSLHVMPPKVGGYHPLDSIVQTLEWCDRLSVGRGEGRDTIEVFGAQFGESDNLVLKAVEEVRSELDVPPLDMKLKKVLPIAAGLGGGSSDAAAALVAVREIVGSAESIDRAAARVGADVPLFLTGGTLRMTGLGEQIEPMPAAVGFAVAVALPDFGLDTPDVYDKWDQMEGPEGVAIPDDLLPPSLRGGMPMRNDLLPAALELEPRLGDFMSDLRASWGTTVCLTGSGSGCFGYFTTLDEASDAGSAVSDLCSLAVGVALRDHGVARV